MKRTFLAVAAVAALVLLGGCAHRRVVAETPYWQVVTTDLRGCWIAEWIAEGDLTKGCNSYCFWAVQRRIFRPYTLTFKYPLGRWVYIKAPNIIVTPTQKPLWLRQIEPYMPPPDQCRRTTVCRYIK